MNSDRRYPWAACSSTASKPACFTRQAASLNRSTSSRISAIEASRISLPFSSAFS